MAHLYLEDLPVGKLWHTGEFVMTPEEAVGFASRYDPQPMHLDAEAAATGRFGELIASGWNTAALAMSTCVHAKLFGDTEMLGLGVDKIQWPNPVRHGDRVSVEVEVLANTPSQSKPDHGVLKIQTRAKNQRGEMVLIMTSNCWVPRRTAKG
jgi:acyl dehydratase